MTKFIVKTIDIVFVCLMTLIVYCMCYTITQSVLGGALSVAVAIAFAVAVCVFVFLFCKPIKAILKRIVDLFSKIPAWKLGVFLLLFSVVTKVTLVFVLDFDADWHIDTSMYRSFAEQLAESGKVVENRDWALSYKYTFIYGVFLSPFAKLFGSDTKALTASLSVLISVCMVLLFDILKKYTGKEIAFVVLMLYNILPMGLFQTQQIIHENGLVICHIIAFWLFWKSFYCKKRPVVQLLLVIFASFILSIGKSINASGRVFTISFGIYAFIKLCENGFSFKKIVKWLCIVMALLVFYMGASTVSNIAVNSLVQDAEEYSVDEKKVMYGWSLYLGLNYESSSVFDTEDYELYNQYKQMDNVEEAKEYQTNLIKERAQQYIDEPIKIPLHLINKVRVLWGTQKLSFDIVETPINEIIQQNENGQKNVDIAGIVYLLLRLFNQGSFILIYAFLLMSKLFRIRNKNSRVTPMYHFQMCVIGVTVALLLFEVTPKYTSHLHVLLFGVLAFELKSFLGDKSIKPLKK